MYYNFNNDEKKTLNTTLGSAQQKREKAIESMQQQHFHSCIYGKYIDLLTCSSIKTQKKKKIRLILVVVVVENRYEEHKEMPIKIKIDFNFMGIFM